MEVSQQELSRHFFNTKAAWFVTHLSNRFLGVAVSGGSCIALDYSRESGLQQARQALHHLPLPYSSRLAVLCAGRGAVTHSPPIVVIPSL